MNEEFKEELSAAIEVALDGTGIRPSWVMKHIKPVIEKYAAQQRLQSDGCKCCAANAKWFKYCPDCGRLLAPAAKA